MVGIYLILQCSCVVALVIIWLILALVFTHLVAGPAGVDPWGRLRACPWTGSILWRACRVRPEDATFCIVPPLRDRNPGAAPGCACACAPEPGLFYGAPVGCARRVQLFVLRAPSLTEILEPRLGWDPRWGSVIGTRQFILARCWLEFMNNFNIITKPDLTFTVIMVTGTNALYNVSLRN